MAIDRSSQSSAVKVKVQEISSVPDPETGRAGKNIKLVQIKQRGQQPFAIGGFGGQDDAMIKNLMSQLQATGLPFFRGEPQTKINLILTESEYDLLGVRFEVNEVYDMMLKDGTIRFTRSLEGV
ncbi:MAG: arcadin 1 [Nitrososphaerales archaeon]